MKVTSYAAIAYFAFLQYGWQPNPVPKPRHKFTVIAHRGDHVKYPENTLAAYQQAIDDRADYAEIDLRTTKDGQLISLHNASVNQMTNGNGLVKDLTIDEVKTLQIKVTGGRPNSNYSIATFDEILSLCKNKIYLYIDFKEADPAAAYASLKRYGMEKQVLVYINNADQLTAWRKVAPKMPLMLSMPDEVKDEAAMEQFIQQYKPDILDGNYKQYNAQLLTIAKNHNIPVWPDGQSKLEAPAIWDEVLSKGLNGLQTDHPQEFIDYLKSKNIR